MNLTCMEFRLRDSSHCPSSADPVPPTDLPANLNAHPSGAALLSGLSMLFGQIGLDLRNLRDLIRHCEGPEDGTRTLLDGALATSAWRCELGARVADPLAPPRITEIEQFLDADLIERLGLHGR